MGALSCYDKMNKIHEQLKEISGEADVRLFFTSEAYGARDGHHNHFVCYCSDKALLPALQNHIKHYFRKNQVDIEPYDENDTGVFYLTKNGIQGADWDLLF